MKTTKEMIEVMQAFDRGEQIQVKTTNKKCDWEDVKEPYWQWNFCDYRVKPNKHFVPFDTAEEFLEAQREHGDMIEGKGRIKAYINSSGEVVITNGKIYDYLSLDSLHYVKYKFIDGTPCGKEVEK